MTVEARCICCENTELTEWLPGLLRCPKCGHIWANESLSIDEIRELYSSKYYQGEEYLDYEAEAAALMKNFEHRLDELVRFAPPGGNLFEIGCAYGYFLQTAKDTYRVAGCEISEHSAQYAREHFSLPVQCGNYLEFAPPAQPFDVVCMWDTIEHLSSPDEFVAKVSREIKPGGVIAISTGDIGSLNARLRGRKWRLLHPPSHLHYFTTASMHRLLERLGFKILMLHHPAFWRDMDATLYRVLGTRPPTAWIYNALHAAHLLNFAFPVNTFDLMTVYARKM